ncbi:MAG: carboxypeptidase-like regulatory domain-containing protein [Gemmatimonadota bacterium]
MDIVCQAAGGILVQVQSSLGNPIPALVTARGPVSREATVPLEDPPAEAGARFADLPPGEYVLTATTPFRTCQSVTITVQVARVASAQIVCDGDPAELAKAFSGDWSFSVLLEDDFGSPLYSQVGGCPPLLNGQPVEGSIAIDAGGGTVSIVGLDPEVTIVGDFEGSWPASGRETRGFSGSGAAARADGSSIQSEVNGSFGFWDGDAPIFFYLDGRMTRKHLDSHGKLVCTERYPVGGDRILFP